MVNTGTGSKNIFRAIEQILLGIVHGYFLLQVIGDVNKILSNYLIVLSLTQLDIGNVI